MDIQSLIKEIFEQGYLMSLATLDDKGIWCADVIYVYDDELNLYWLSDPAARHSQSISYHAQAACTITVNPPHENNLGVQLEGQAKKIDGPRFDLAVKHWHKRNKPSPKETDDVLDGDAWYCLYPKKIELINEALFGFEKQTFIL